MIEFKVGDCLEVFGAEPDGSFDAIVSDPPAGVSFMSRTWDRDHGGRDKWIAFWAERTSGWTHCALEDGGWFVQDVITHVFGQGWPKGKAALKSAAEHWILARNGSGGTLQIDAARVARGGADIGRDTGSKGMWGEGGRIVTESNPAGSWPPNFVLSHCPECEERGTRRVKGERPRDLTGSGSQGYGGCAPGPRGATVGGDTSGLESVPAFDCLAACDCGLSVLAPAGGEAPRCACGAAMWWACPVAEMDGQSGESTSTDRPRMNTAAAHNAGPVLGRSGGDWTTGGHADSGGASRFFPRFTYQAKAAGGERHAGCDGLYWRADKRSPFGFVRITETEWATIDPGREQETIRAGRNEYQQPARARGNVHPTVKSLALMEWLVSLVCPPGGRVGDVTCGSGGTGIAVARLNASKSLGASFLGCDICPEAVEIAEARLAWWQANTAVQEGLFGDATVIEPEPTKPSAPKPAPVAKPPAVDPRQVGLWK